MWSDHFIAHIICNQTPSYDSHSCNQLLLSGQLWMVPKIFLKWSYFLVIGCLIITLDFISYDWYIIYNLYNKLLAFTCMSANSSLCNIVFRQVYRKCNSYLYVICLQYFSVRRFLVTPIIWSLFGRDIQDKIR